MEDCSTPGIWPTISRLTSTVPVVTTPVPELPSHYYLQSWPEAFFILFIIKTWKTSKYADSLPHLREGLKRIFLNLPF